MRLYIYTGVYLQRAQFGMWISNDWSGDSWGECMGFYKALGEVKGGYDGNNESF